MLVSGRVGDFFSYPGLFWTTTSHKKQAIFVSTKWHVRSLFFCLARRSGKMILNQLRWHISYLYSNLWFHCPLAKSNYAGVSQNHVTPETTEHVWFGHRLILKVPRVLRDSRFVSNKNCLRHRNLGMLRQRLMFPCQVERRQGRNAQVSVVSVSSPPPPPNFTPRLLVKWANVRERGAQDRWMNVGFDTVTAFQRNSSFLYWFLILIISTHFIRREHTWRTVQWFRQLNGPNLCEAFYVAVVVFWSGERIFFRTSSWKKEHESRPWETLSGLDEFASFHCFRKPIAIEWHRVSILNFLVFHFWLPWKNILLL